MLQPMSGVDLLGVRLMEWRSLMWNRDQHVVMENGGVECRVQRHQRNNVYTQVLA